MEVENQGLEFKRKVENFREIGKTVCAFANANGGRIVIGVADDGKVIGVPDDAIDTLQQRFEGTIQQVSPVPFHRISVEERDGKRTVVIDVHQIGQSAFCTYDGIVYYRTGSVNSKLSGRTLQEYLMNRYILSFDESRSQAVLVDIDLDKLGSFLKARSPNIKFNAKKVQDYLISLNLAQMNGTLWIKSATLLFFAREPTRLIPQSEVKLARFKGKVPVDIIDSKFEGGTVLDILRVAEDFIKRNTRTAMRIAALKREDVAEYPEPVTREALVNALTHRDYFSRDAVQINIFDDRMEVLSPGNLPVGLDIKLLGTVSKQRNPLTYHMMRDLDLVEGLATGIPRMRSAMRVAGLPEPVFEELGGFFRVTLYNKARVDATKLNKRQKHALGHLKENPTITSKAYAEMVKVSHPMAVADLNDLVAKGIIRKVGKTRGAYYEPAEEVNNII
jgi:ATP-dependent DNA helicase RecG